MGKNQLINKTISSGAFREQAEQLEESCFEIAGHKLVFIN